MFKKGGVLWLVGGMQCDLTGLVYGVAGPFLHAVENGGHAVEFVAIAAARDWLSEVGSVCLFQDGGQTFDGLQGSTYEQAADENAE